ncbi:integrin beta-8-like [Sinocyclocheilus anshuiensis]|uniref:integrin beta-8-like n=1 Tax=Sinocyclocheilus anshuiensis TaxID=1608454 RepID=UPI0007B794B5|nr:PREDICTED: integrin beta-8-like [Sinocyclocheilus anshuiensis]
MTSCMRPYCDLIALRLLLLLLLLVRSDSADNRCLSSLISTCEDCLRRGPECAWCSQEKFLDRAHVSQRCGSVSDLRVRGCEEVFIENPNVKVEVNATISSSQVSPREINIHLRPGGEAMFVIEVQQLERYPVDLYYLVDVSASMQDNLDRLKTAGLALSHQMKEHSSDFRVGFGSFVDKPVSPYIDVHPSKHCSLSDYEVHCRPAHGFIHVLPVTQNMTEFTRVIQEQRISGNMDTPEGGFDAMLQAAVCQKDIGWRPEAKHLLLVMTDQPSHLALDSKLAGIVVPHDGRCHLEDNIYSQTTTMEHPTIAQLAEKLLENSVYSIFAVDQVQYQWYEDLLDLIPGSYVGRLFPKASNLKDLIVHAYKKLLSDVEVQIGLEDAQAQRFRVNVTAFCPNGSTVSGSTKCSSVQPRQTVFFKVTVGMSWCPAEDGDQDVLMSVRPVGFNESVTVRIRQICGCGCTETGRCHDDPDPSPCPAETAVCRADRSEPVCSRRGTCKCGTCVCDSSRLGNVYGKFCEMDDFSCPYVKDLVCGGHGQCVSGECVCLPGWTGETCDCPVSTESCVSDDGLICSGWGKCVCGKCVCDDSRRSGALCEKCPICDSSCQSHWSCVNCHLSNGLGSDAYQLCNHSCAASSVEYVDDITELVRGKYCLYPSSEKCQHCFLMDLASERPQLHISRHPVCVWSRRYFKTFLSAFLLTVTLGICMLAAVRQLLRARNCSWQSNPEQQFERSPKDSSYIPTTNEKTIPYRSDGLPNQPVEMHSHMPKMPLSHAWQ